MAIPQDLALRDMYRADIGDEDVRLVTAGWIYYVRAVKRPSQLLRSDANAGSTGSLLGDLLFGLAWSALRQRLDRRRPWLLGVVRMGDVATWNDIEPRTVHTEALASDETIAAGIKRLATDVTAGRFAVGSA